MIRIERYGIKKCLTIVLILLCMATVFTGCKSKQYNTKDDYKNTISGFADKYGYEIVSETMPWTDIYEIAISNGTEQFAFTFWLGSEKQMNHFEIWCENPISFDLFLKIANELSKKKFSEAFYYNVINNENLFYNKDDEEHAYYKDEYDFYKSDYFVIFDSEFFSIDDDDYNLSYYSVSGRSTLCIAGFTK